MRWWSLWLCSLAYGRLRLVKKRPPKVDNVLLVISAFGVEGRTNRLNRLNWKKHEVFYEADFLLNEGLGVTYPSQQPVMARRSEGPLANIIFRNEDGIRC